MEVRLKKPAVRVEPSQAAIPHGQYFAFRIVAPVDLQGYEIHWTYNGRRMAGAHKPELGFAYMRPRFDGEYKALLIKGGEILASNCVKLTTLAAGARAETSGSGAEPQNEAYFFDPRDLAGEDGPESAAPEEQQKKKAFLEKALKKTKKAA